MRVCRTCQKTKPDTDFTLNRTKTGKVRRRLHCKRCVSVQKRLRYRDGGIVRHRQQKYGLTKEQYEELSIRQGGVCGCCKRDKPLTVDHDHATNTIRGLLCDDCNKGIGCLGDTFAGHPQCRLLSASIVKTKNSIDRWARGSHSSPLCRAQITLRRGFPLCMIRT
jgi:hypothetical protein